MSSCGTGIFCGCKKGECTIELGFVWSDLLTSLERVADHCSNIAGCVIEMSHDSLDVHEYLDNVKAGGPWFPPGL